MKGIEHVTIEGTRQREFDACHDALKARPGAGLPEDEREFAQAGQIRRGQPARTVPGIRCGRLLAAQDRKGQDLDVLRVET